MYPPPQFIVPLRDVSQFESGKVHFEARIEPVGDPTMHVEWYLNGRLIEASKCSVIILIIVQMLLQMIIKFRFQSNKHVPLWILGIGFD